MVLNEQTLRTKSSNVYPSRNSSANNQNAHSKLNKGEFSLKRSEGEGLMAEGAPAKQSDELTGAGELSVFK